MPTSQNLELPGDENKKSDVPQPVPTKPEVREEEKKPPAGDPPSNDPPEAL